MLATVTTELILTQKSRILREEEKRAYTISSFGMIDGRVRVRVPTPRVRV